jgi:hypothetical protein
MKEKKVTQDLAALLEKKKQAFAKLNLADAAKVLGGTTATTDNEASTGEKTKFLRHDVLRW